MAMQGVVGLSVAFSQPVIIWMGKNKSKLTMGAKQKLKYDPFPPGGSLLLMSKMVCH